MRFLKSTTLLLVAALANPMCCCLVLGEAESETVPVNQVVDAHACCHSTADATSEQPDNSAAPADRDCYHEDIKLTQYNDVSSHSHSLISSFDTLQCVYLSSTEYFAPKNLNGAAASEYRPLDSHSPPGSRISRSFCVYLI